MQTVAARVRPSSSPPSRRRGSHLEAAVADRRRRWSSRRDGPVPGWPLVVLIGGFPVWWLLGLGVLGWLIAAVPMTYYLLRRRTIAVPRGFGVWLLFLLWAVAGGLVLGLDAPGTQPGPASDRLVGYAFRLCWYLTATVTLLYVGNHREEDLPSVRLHRLLAWLFLVTVAGGYVGYLAPSLELRSPVEALLPSGLPGADFLELLVHPSVAQVQDIGIEVTRPSAPYVYANDWGAAYGLLLPFFILAWTGPSAGWRRRWFPFIAVASVPPAIFTLNRGLWIGVAVMGLVAALRMLLLGRLGGLVALTAATGAGLVAVAVTPLGALVTARLANQHSNDGRTALADRAVEAALASPVVGFGSTRELQGNFFSIAGGDSPLCPGCSAPLLGTQGHLWLLIFAHGFVGAALFLAFFVRRTAPYLRTPTRQATAVIASAAFYAAVMPVYDLSNVPLVLLMVGIALLWRSETRTRHVEQARGAGP